MKLSLRFAGLVSIFSLLHICASAQMLVPSKTNIDFGNVYATELDSEIITLSNPYDFAINVLEIHMYDSAFSTPYTQFYVAGKGSYELKIYFRPTQNVKYKSGLIILNDGRQGNLALNVTGQGKFKDAYYNTTENLWEEDLKAALKTLTAKNYTQLGYDNARNLMFMEIDNQKVNGLGASNNTLECVYTGRIISNFASRSEAQTNGNFNTEHTFPQSFFSEAEPMKSDLFHLFPSDAMANTRRSNYPFGVVTNPTWQEGGSKGITGLFEPRDVHKGNAARALFYFVVRYQDYGNFVKGQETILRKWMNTDTVDAVESQRNDDIFKYQKNRNPFVDHPEFLQRITSLTSVFVPSDDYSIAIPSSKVTFGKVSVGDSVIYNFPLAATGNKNVRVFNVKFNNPDYRTIKGEDTMLPGESGYFTFVYKPIAGFKSHIDTMTFTVTNKTDVEIKVPISVDGNVGFSDVTFNEILLNVYPNPVSGTLYITMPENTLQSAAMYNILGEKVLEKQGAVKEINTGSLPKGIYILKINAGEKIYSRKVIKQ
ncbi:MAG: endonuclease [Bacteroidia bacterium]